MQKIKIPKDSASDTKVRVLKIFHRNGDLVKENESILEYETSKANMEVNAEGNGHIYHFINEGDEILVGNLVSIVSTKKLSEKEHEALDKQYKNTKFEKSDKKIITKKAEIIINENNININKIDSPVITEDIVIKFLKNNKIKNNLKFSDKDIVIIGIGGHANMCIDVLKKNSNYNIKGYVDDTIKLDKVNGYNYLGNLNIIEELSALGLKNIIIGIGFLNNLKKRDRLYERLKKNFKIPNLIHKSAIIEESAIIGKGCQIMAGAIIGSYVSIEDNTIINSGSIISHNTIVGQSSHITPGATLAGHVTIGKRTTIGMCATIYIESVIGDDLIINNNENVINGK